MKGSEHNDLHNSDGTTKRIFPAVFRWNQQWYGHFFRVAFKPVATIMQKQESLDNQGNITEMTGKGRHDPCVVPRAVPIVEAMAVLADFYLINKIY
jgi:chorismate synthase